MWPFPRKAFENLPESVKGFVTVEMSISSQMGEDIMMAAKNSKPLYGCLTNVNIPKAKENRRLLPGCPGGQGRANGGNLKWPVYKTPKSIIAPLRLLRRLRTRYNPAPDRREHRGARASGSGDRLPWTSRAPSGPWSAWITITSPALTAASPPSQPESKRSARTRPYMPSPGDGSSYVIGWTETTYCRRP